MSLFTSNREKRLWIYSFIVLIAILLTLVFGTQLVALQLKQDIQHLIFWLCIILIGLTIIIQGLKVNPNKIEIAIWFGITAVYLLLILRFWGVAERTHLMEYSVLAVFIHEALIERTKLNSHILKTALRAFTITLIIGVLDECIQIFLPSREFDPLDILFNGLAGLLAIGLSVILGFLRKKMRKINT